MSFNKPNTDCIVRSPRDHASAADAAIMRKEQYELGRCFHFLRRLGGGQNKLRPSSGNVHHRAFTENGTVAVEDDSGLANNSAARYAVFDFHRSYLPRASQLSRWATKRPLTKPSMITYLQFHVGPPKILAPFGRSALRKRKNCFYTPKVLAPLTCDERSGFLV